MNPKTATALPPDAPLKPVGLPYPQKPAIIIQCVWKYESKLPKAQEYRDMVLEEDLENFLPPFEQTLTLEPVARRENVLDYVRTQYRLERCKGQIQSFHLKLISESKCDIETLTDDWGKIQSALWDSTWDAKKSVSYTIVRPAEEGEVIFQGKIPFDVEQFLTVKDGDISRIAPSDDKTDEKKLPNITEGYVYALQAKTATSTALPPDAPLKPAGLPDPQKPAITAGRLIAIGLLTEQFHTQG